MMDSLGFGGGAEVFTLMFQTSASKKEESRDVLPGLFVVLEEGLR